MKKRILSILTALALCLTLLPTVALADTTPSGTALTQDDISSDMTLSDGEYYLGDDITLSSPLAITGAVTLDLNGHTLTGAAGSNATDNAEDGGNGGTAIIVNGGSLTVNGGTITGGNGGAGGSSGGSNGSGGTAIIVNSGSLTVNGGTITGGNGGSNIFGGSGGDGGSGAINGGNGGNGGHDGSGGDGGNGLRIKGGTVSVGSSGTIKGGDGGNGGNGLRIEGGAVSVGGSGTIEGGGGDGGKYDGGSDGDDGKTISTSGTGSIGVSSAAALKTAVDAGVSSIKLMDDITLSSSLTFKDKEFTLDLNGHVLSFTNSKKLRLEETSKGSSTTVTLIDSRPTATHSNRSLPRGGIVNGNILLTRQTKEDTNLVTLHANGGTVTGTVTLCETAVIDCTGDTPTAFMGSVSDYDDGSDKVDSAGSLQGGIFYGELKAQYLTQPSNNVTGYAVTFMNGDDRHAFEVVKDGGTAVAPTEPTRDGYVFAGWSEYEWLGAENLDEETDYLFSLVDTPITKHLTLKALWQRKLSECTVTVDTLPYTGEAQTPSVTITDGEKTLEMGSLKDYIFLTDGNSVTSATAPGTYALTIRGTWAYCGDVTVEWSIAAPVSSGDDSEPSYSVTLPNVKNGTVKADRRTAEAGDTVTLTVTPDKGYTLETLTVTDKNGKELELKDLGNGKYSFKMPAGKVTVNASFMDDNTMLNFFVDVTADKYYYDAVLWAAENGITGGVDETHFAPYSTCTRGQMAAFLYRCAQARDEGFTGAWMFRLPFGDVPEWCYESVAWCYMNNIVGGYGDGAFGTGDTVTRQQAVTMLYRFAVAMGMDVSVGADTNILSYNDAFDVAEYAVEAFQWAVGAGIVQGNDGCLNPTAPCTRAQIVTFLYRLLGE